MTYVAWLIHSGGMLTKSRIPAAAALRCILRENVRCSEDEMMSLSRASSVSSLILKKLVLPRPGIDKERHLDWLPPTCSCPQARGWLSLQLVLGFSLQSWEKGISVVDEQSVVFCYSGLNGRRRPVSVAHALL